jgi:hypothetical protein
VLPFVYTLLVTARKLSCRTFKSRSSWKERLVHPCVCFCSLFFVQIGVCMISRGAEFCSEQICHGRTWLHVKCNFVKVQDSFNLYGAHLFLGLHKRNTNETQGSKVKHNPYKCALQVSRMLKYFLFGIHEF